MTCLQKVRQEIIQRSKPFPVAIPSGWLHEELYESFFLFHCNTSDIAERRKAEPLVEPIQTSVPTKNIEEIDESYLKIKTLNRKQLGI